MKLEKNKNNLAQIASLVEYSFGKNQDITNDINFMSRYEHSDGYGYFNKKQLVSYIMVNHFESEVFGHHVPMAGIGYVSTYPEDRGKGYISKLMNEILQDLHEQNVPIANLAPFSEAFYRKYGFSNTIYQKQYLFGRDALATFKMPRNGKIVRGKWTDLVVQNGVIQLYERQLHTDDERNTMIRKAWWWNRLDTYYQNRNVAVYFDVDGRPVSYVIYRIRDAKFIVDELYSITPHGWLSILGFMKAHISSVKEFCVTLREHSIFSELFPEQKQLKISLHPYMMSRILDFEKVLSCMRPVQEGQFNIEVNYDDQCPWNIGIWQLTNQDHQVSCKRVDDALVDFSGPIEAWTQVLLGRLTMKSAIELGLITDYRIKKLDFVKGDVSFYDYF